MSSGYIIAYFIGFPLGLFLVIMISRLIDCIPNKNEHAEFRPVEIVRDPEKFLLTKAEIRILIQEEFAILTTTSEEANDE